MKTRSAIAATLFACLPAIAGERQSVAEFTPEESEKLDWRVVDDGVMGGLSQGKREIGKDGILRFFGTLSLENNGGFSSLRTGTVKLDLSGAEGVMLRVKGDGRTYQVRLSTDAEYRGREMSFQAGFPTDKGRVDRGQGALQAFRRHLAWHGAAGQDLRPRQDPSPRLAVG